MAIGESGGGLEMGQTVVEREAVLWEVRDWEVGL